MESNSLRKKVAEVHLSKHQNSVFLFKAFDPRPSRIAIANKFLEITLFEKKNGILSPSSFDYHSEKMAYTESSDARLLLNSNGETLELMPDHYLERNQMYPAFSSKGNYVSYVEYKGKAAYGSKTIKHPLYLINLETGEYDIVFEDLNLSKGKYNEENGLWLLFYQTEKQRWINHYEIWIYDPKSEQKEYLGMGYDAIFE